MTILKTVFFRNHAKKRTAVALFGLWYGSWNWKKFVATKALKERLLGGLNDSIPSLNLIRDRVYDRKHKLINYGSNFTFWCLKAAESCVGLYRVRVYVFL